MGDVFFSFEGIAAFMAAIDAKVAAASAGAEKLARQASGIIQAEAKPLSPVLTGTNRRSITMTRLEKVGPGTWESHTAPTTAYGRRLELGFHGIDSLGRVYSDYDALGRPQGFLYLRAGLERAIPRIIALQQTIWSAAMKA